MYYSFVNARLNFSAVMDHLSTNIRLENTSPDTCSLNDVDMGLVMALLYAMDVSRVSQVSHLIKRAFCEE